MVTMYPDAAELFAAAAASQAADGAAGGAEGGAAGGEAAAAEAQAAGGEAQEAQAGQEAAPPANMLAWLAQQTDGFSGSDLVQLCSQAAAVPIQEAIE